MQKPGPPFRSFTISETCVYIIAIIEDILKHGKEWRVIRFLGISIIYAKNSVVKITIYMFFLVWKIQIIWPYQAEVKYG